MQWNLVGDLRGQPPEDFIGTQSEVRRLGD